MSGHQSRCRHPSHLLLPWSSTLPTAVDTAHSFFSLLSTPQQQPKPIRLHLSFHTGSEVCGRQLQQRLLQNKRQQLQRDVSAAAAAGAADAAPAPAPEGLFWRKVCALALIFLGSTVNYTILQVGFASSSSLGWGQSSVGMSIQGTDFSCHTPFSPWSSIAACAWSVHLGPCTATLPAVSTWDAPGACRHQPQKTQQHSHVHPLFTCNRQAGIVLSSTTCSCMCVGR